MELDLGTGPSIKHPTVADVAAAVATMGERDYLILARDTDTFMQTTEGVVEYRENAAHYRHELPDYDLTVVQELLQSYLHDDGVWRNRVAWQDVTAELNALNRRARIEVWLYVALVAAFLIWVLIRLL